MTHQLKSPSTEVNSEGDRDGSTLFALALEKIEVLGSEEVKERLAMLMLFNYVLRTDQAKFSVEAMRKYLDYDTLVFLDDFARTIQELARETGR